MVSSKGPDNLLADGSGVFVIHLLFTFDWDWLWSVQGQRQDLEVATVKGDEVLFNEPVPCQEELVDRDSQKGAHLVIGVKRQAVSVGHEDQKQVEQKFTVSEVIEKPLFEESMLDKPESTVNLTDPVGTNDDFFHHGLRPPLGHTLKRKKIENPSSPFLQELDNYSESENIDVISSPSLQDSFWQESGDNSLVLRGKYDLTRPSLQDCRDPGASGPGAFGEPYCVLRSQGSLPCISDSSRGFFLSRKCGFPADSYSSLGQCSSSLSASAVYGAADTLACGNTGDSLLGDRGRKLFGSWDWRTGSSVSWFLPPGKNHKVIDGFDTG
jgi:hypothetical protein